VPRKESKFTMGRVYFDSRCLSMFGPIGLPTAAVEPRLAAFRRAFHEIMAEITRFGRESQRHIISFQNDDCYKYPIAYLCEVDTSISRTKKPTG